MSRMRPPLTTSMTGPETTSSFSLICLDRAPGALVLRALLRQDEAAVLVLLLEDERFELLAERHDLVRVDVVADRQLLDRDDALGLVADVEQHLVGVDLDDRAGDDVAVVELDDRGVDRVGERHAAEVVDDDVLLHLVRLVGVFRRFVGVACPLRASAAVVSATAAVRRRGRVRFLIQHFDSCFVRVDDARA